MILDLNNQPLRAIGTQPHWAMLTAVMADPVVFNPLNFEVTQLVAAAIAANPTRPFISSRQAGADVLRRLGTTWHAEFPRRFPAFPNGAERGLFGMALWNYLASHPDRWYFAGVADPYGYGQDSTDYWRP
ncbi:MAG: hypothetical protein JWN70_1601 [Planctomycetaceae bacterium]|nr:hypothetical protein [Planctomycetaceae bacterium]